MNSPPAGDQAGPVLLAAVVRLASRTGYQSFLADPGRQALRVDLGSAAPTGRAFEVDEE